jgi:hypothetical protein
MIPTLNGMASSPKTPSRACEAAYSPECVEGNSANFALTEFSEVELLLSRVLMIGTPFAPLPHVLRHPPEGPGATFS